MDIYTVINLITFSVALILAYTTKKYRILISIAFLTTVATIYVDDFQLNFFIYFCGTATWYVFLLKETNNLDSSVSVYFVYVVFLTLNLVYLVTENTLFWIISLTINSIFGIIVFYQLKESNYIPAITLITSFLLAFSIFFNELIFTFALICYEIGVVVLIFSLYWNHFTLASKPEQRSFNI